MHTHEPGEDVRALWAPSHVGAGGAVNSDPASLAACRHSLRTNGSDLKLFPSLRSRGAGPRDEGFLLVFLKVRKHFFGILTITYTWAEKIPDTFPARVSRGFFAAEVEGGKHSLRVRRGGTF